MKDNLMQEVLVDYNNVYLLEKYTWSINSEGYIVAWKPKEFNQKREKLFLHRLIMQCPKNMEVDHINGNKLDNRRSNLRIVTHHQNLMNRSVTKNNHLGVKGIRKMGNKYQARIGINKKNICLGTFSTLQEAIEIHTQAINKYHKEFGRIK